MTQPTYSSGLLFTRAHTLVRQRIYSVLEKYDLNPTYWAVLGATARAEEGIRLVKVAEQIGMTPAMITIMANELIEKGLINRVPHHSDKRAKLLVLTAMGRSVANNVEKELQGEIACLLHGLKPAEISAFQKTLETIIENAQL